MIKRVFGRNPIMKKHKIIRLALYFLIGFLILNIGSEVFLMAKANEEPDGAIETEEIKDLKSLIGGKQQEIKNLHKEIKKYNDLIKVKHEQANTLEAQISILENQIVKTELDVKRMEVQIEKIGLEIEEKNKEIEITEENIALQKARIAENIRLINRSDERDYLELLLMNDKFSDFFDALNSLKNIEMELKNIFDDLLILKNNLEEKKAELQKQNEELKKNKKNLDDEKEKLDNQRYGKEVILSQTIQTEKEFKNLVYQIQQEQNQTFYQINKLESKVKAKLEAERERRKKLGKEKDDPTKLSWPIPNQGITAYFHDPDYPFRKWIGEHSGIDIRTLIDGRPSNGLPVKSAADGMVLKIIREGKLAGNILYILHDNNIMTVYMHLSRIDVKEEQYVSRGDKVGLTGGMPGTPGAGQISTGPHLHFEVRLNGIPVDPLHYLQ